MEGTKTKYEVINIGYKVTKLRILKSSFDTHSIQHNDDKSSTNFIHSLHIQIQLSFLSLPYISYTVCMSFYQTIVKLSFNFIGISLNNNLHTHATLHTIIVCMHNVSLSILRILEYIHYTLPISKAYSE